MSQTQKHLLTIVLSTLFLTFIVWLPHYFRLDFYNLSFSEGFNTIYRNFDGVEYIVIAKTFYHPSLIVSYPLGLNPNYYAAHFPGFALALLLFAPLLGFLKSMLFTSILFTILSAISFYFLIRDFSLSKQPLFLALLFLILPARWLIVHSVGSAEPMFIFFCILSLYYFLKYETHRSYDQIILAGVFGLLAQLTRPPGILLFISYGLYILWKILSQRRNLFPSLWRSIYTYFPLILIPLGLLSVFLWYSYTYNNFFAYFTSGDNIHLVFPPYQVFNKSQFWVGDIWLEDIIYVYFLGFLGTIYLFKQNLKPLAFFVLTYLLATIFVAHRDISRYVLPIFPFLLIAFEKLLVSKEFKIVLAIVALAIYLYAQNFLLANTAPIPNLQIFD